MISIILPTTASQPSFGMPVHASAAAVCGAGAVIRDRHLGGTWTTDVALVADAVKRAFPGTSAWRPPTC